MRGEGFEVRVKVYLGRLAHGKKERWGDDVILQSGDVILQSDDIILHSFL